MGEVGFRVSGFPNADQIERRVIGLRDRTLLLTEFPAASRDLSRALLGVKTRRWPAGAGIRDSGRLPYVPPCGLPMAQVTLWPPLMALLRCERK